MSIYQREEKKSKTYPAGALKKSGKAGIEKLVMKPSA
jgi:hypothetical protein